MKYHPHDDYYKRLANKIRENKGSYHADTPLVFDVDGHDSMNAMQVAKNPATLFVVENVDTHETHIISSDEFEMIDFDLSPEPPRVDWLRRIELSLLCIIFFCMGFAFGALL